jgi:heme exporter protein B
MRAALLAMVRRDLLLTLRRPGDSIVGLVFLVLALSLFPLGVGASPEVLARIGAGVIWVLALLAVLIGLERLWQVDHEDGSLELMVLAPAPLELLALARCAAHWLSSGFVLTLVSPLLGILMGLPAEALWALPTALLLGTPTLTLLGSVGSALLLGSRRGNVLAALLVLPLYIPVLIFGVSAVDAYVLGLGGGPQLMILAAMLLLSVALAPFAITAALRLSVE